VSEGEWGDPLGGDDPVAREREERRREREERRRQRLGRRVQDAQARPEPAARVPASPPEPPRPEPPPPAPTPAAPSRWARPRAGTIVRRRIAALVAVLAVVAIVVGVGVVVADRLSDEPPPAPALKTGSVTIPEGYDRTQVADIAREAGLRGDYEKETVRSRTLSPLDYGANAFPDLEGFLFPDTYEVDRGARVEDLVDRQLQTFKQRFREVDMSYARSRNLTSYDVVTIASMIEREVSVPAERPLVAAVIYNRLHQGMPLGIDATLRFALHNFDRPLKESELDSSSPYNTRRDPGLPPGPIGSPGLDSLQAAANPAREDYLYYVIEPGTCNEHFFTADEDEFTAAAERYQAALEAEGGSPTEC
jgi:UPF0755 protein